MTQQIYIETSVVSYFTARESSDIVRSACQQITKLWWNNDRLNCATYHELDILLTWNCTHIANPSKLPVMRGLCSARGYKLPELVTPFELMESSQ